MKFSKLVIAILVVASFLPVKAQLELQTCVTSSRNPWEWPGHNNWFTASAISHTGWITNFSDGTKQTIGGPSSPINAYEGVTAASDDRGNLIFITNGRYVWDKDGNKTYDGLLEGNENGATLTRGSAAQGTMCVRHPLAPNDYYVFTTDDANGGSTLGFNYAVFDETGANIQGTSRLGSFRTCEGLAATFHQNGVDIWILIQASTSTDFHAFLLTCSGITEHVISPVANMVTGSAERGGIAISWDGSKVAAGFPSPWPNADKQICIYDFDNKTGVLSNQKGIAPTGKVLSPYDMTFGPDNNSLYITSYVGDLFSFDVSSNDKATMAGTFTEHSKPGFSHTSIEIGGDGQLYFANNGMKKGTPGSYSSVSQVETSLGLPTMYIPPAEEPDIEEVGSFCDTSAAVDLHTNWVCSGVSAEDTLYKRHLYAGKGITDPDLGIFDPAVAGVGTHEIVFTYCDVNDTIWIEVIKCPACKAKLKDVEPRICAGNEVRLDTMILQGTQTRTWTIDSAPVPTPLASLNISGGDTIFNALNTNIKSGTYKLKMQAEYDGDFCYDTMYITVDSLPIPVLEDSTICSDWDAVTIGPGAFDSYVWSTGATDPTIDVTVADDYSVTVTDANGCVGDTMMTLTVNDLPIAVLPNDTNICEGDPAIIFSASGSTGGSGSNIATYTWENGDNGDSKSTDVDGEYWVAVEDENGCRDTDTVVLVVNALPVVELRNDTSICDGDAALTLAPLNPDANDSIYTWGNGDIANSIDVDTAGTYKVVLTDKNGCLDSTEFTLTINELPTIDLPDSTICGDAPNVVWDAEAATPGMAIYQWVELPGLTPVGAGAVLDTKTAGDYAIAIVDVNQCAGADTITLVVNNFVPVDLGPDTAICEDADPVVLNAGIANCNWYLWTPDNGTATDQQTYTVDTEAMYRVQLEDENGCSGEDSIYVSVNPLPVVDLGNDTAICVDHAAVVFDAGNAGVGMEYSWSNSETSQTISTSEDGEYWVAIEDVNGCTDTDTVVLTVNALPVVDLGPDQEICQAEDSVTFDAGHPTAQSWVWDHGPTTQTIKAHFDPGNAAGDETYTVTVTDTNGCVNDTFVVLTVNPMPSVDVRDSSVCMDAPDVTFDVGATFDSYTWKDGGSSQTQTYADAGKYYVTFTTASGCEGTDTFELVRNPLPTPDLGNDTIICFGSGSVTFTPGDFEEYAWSNASTSPSITTDEANTYSVEVTDANGCKASDEVELVVIELPDPQILTNATKCPGSSFTFDVTAFDNGNGPFTYTWHDGSTSSTFQTNDEVAAWVDITDQYGCTGRDEGEVTDKSDLTVVINDGNPIDLCEGEDVLLIPNYKAADGYNFGWSNAMTSTSETVTADATGLYQLHVDNGGGCEGDGQIQVTVHPNPVVNPTPAGVCDGEPATIGDNQGSNFNYSWNNGETGATIQVLNPGTYTQTLTHKTTGCIGSGSFEVTVHSNPSPDLGNDVTVCEGVIVTLQDLSGEAIVSQSWSTGESTESISPTSNGTYTINVETQYGCTGTDEVNVSFILTPKVDLGPDIVLCEGESATIDAGNPTLQVQWNTGASTNSITVDQTSTNIATVSDNGCPASDTVEVTVVALPESQIDKSLGSEPYCFAELTRGIEVSAGNNDAYDYLWSTGETTNSIDVIEAGTYQVKISAGNCSIDDYIVFNDFCPSTLFIPNAFTPDGNGINDSFNAQATYVEDYEMYIYNRWGEMIYHSESLENDWDGTYMGNECQIDVYVYKIYYSVNHPDGHPRKEQKVGTVTLMR